MKIFVEVGKAYAKLYDKKIGCMKGHEIREIEIDDELASKTMYVGLSVASNEDIHGYGIELSDNLDLIRAVREATNTIAIRDLISKTNENVEYKIKNFEWYLKITKV